MKKQSQTPSRSAESADVQCAERQAREVLRHNTTHSRFVLIITYRHTNISLLITGGTDVTTMAELLGHSQPSTTLGNYTHAFDKNKRITLACGITSELENLYSYIKG